MDNAAPVDDTTFAGSYTFSNVPAGSHLLSGYLVGSSGAKITGSDATVSFTSSVASTSTPPAGPIVKHITLSVEGSSQKNFTGKLLFYRPGTATEVTERDITTDATGAADVTLSNISSTVDVRVSIPGYLAKLIPAVDVTISGNLSFGQLTAGDLNGDGIVNSIDYSLMASKFGQAYDLADFTKSGVVNAADIGILINNWNKTAQ